MGFLSSIMLLIIASLIVTLFCVAATFTITVLIPIILELYIYLKGSTIWLKMGKAVVELVNFLFKLLDSGINTVNLINRKKCENFSKEIRAQAFFSHGAYLQRFMHNYVSLNKWYGSFLLYRPLYIKTQVCYWWNSSKNV